MRCRSERSFQVPASYAFKAVEKRYRTLKPSPVRRPMSLVRPMKKSMITSTKPTRAGALHHPEGHRSAAHLLDQAPEDVAAVERQEREEVDQAEREADHGEQDQRLAGAELDRLVGDVADADDARDLLALLRVEEVGEDAHASSCVTSHMKLAGRLGGIRRSRGSAGVRAVGEADPGAVRPTASYSGRIAIVRASPVSLHPQRHRGGGPAAVHLLARAPVRLRRRRRS